VDTVVICVVIVILTLGIALVTSVIETKSGYLGDHSMVPVVVGVGLFIGLIVAVAGLVAGDWSVTFN